MEYRLRSPLSLRTKLRSSISCFVGGHQQRRRHRQRHRHEALQPASRPSLSEKPMCRSLISLLGTRSTRCHCYPTDFSYDPSSYALNFDDGQLLDNCPFRSFSARLPPSPAKGAFAVACGFVIDKN